MQSQIGWMIHEIISLFEGLPERCRNVIAGGRLLESGCSSSPPAPATQYNHFFIFCLVLNMQQCFIAPRYKTHEYLSLQLYYKSLVQQRSMMLSFQNYSETCFQLCGVVEVFLHQWHPARLSSDFNLPLQCWTFLSEISSLQQLHLWRRFLTELRWKEGEATSVCTRQPCDERLWCNKSVNKTHAHTVQAHRGLLVPTAVHWPSIDSKLIVTSRILLEV